MKLELALPPQDADRLLRLRLLAGLKAARRRHRAVSIIWHDTADGALVAEGLVLATQGGTWRLERLLPGEEAWPPGGVAPVIEQAAALDRLAHPLPADQRPIARFDGSLDVLALRREGMDLTLELLHGRAGWARHRQPACRVRLEGEDAAVLALATELAGALDLEVPTRCLAAEAIGVAQARPPADRHDGPPRLRAGLRVGEAFVLAVGQLTDVILAQARHVLNGGPDTEPVHQLRVAVRRLRSAIAVFRPAVACPTVDAANHALKALADRLGPARDWDVFVAETAAAVSAALPEDAGLRVLQRTAGRQRRAAYTALRQSLREAEFRRLGVALAGLAGSTAWQHGLEPAQQEVLGQPLEAFGAQALRRRLRRLTEAGETIEHLDAAALHIVRLRAKRMRYAAELFAPLYSGKATRRFLRRLAALQDRLGVLNDGAVADGLLGHLGGGRAHAAGLVRGFLAARAGGSRTKIKRAWERFRRLEPFWS